MSGAENEMDNDTRGGVGCRQPFGAGWPAGRGHNACRAPRRSAGGSFAHLSKAIEAIGQTNALVNPSPISPLKRGEVTRSALVVESLMHACDHYGQIVEYLRMNGVVPPASRP